MIYHFNSIVGPASGSERIWVGIGSVSCFRVSFFQVNYCQLGSESVPDVILGKSLDPIWGPFGEPFGRWVGAKSKGTKVFWCFSGFRIGGLLLFISWQLLVTILGSFSGVGSWLGFLAIWRFILSQQLLFQFNSGLCPQVGKNAGENRLDFGVSILPRQILS